MTEEENKAIEYLKRHIIPCYENKGRIEFMLNDTLLNLIEKLQKENRELKSNNIPKDKIKNYIKEYEKEIETYENKMLEITQREKHHAIENEDYINYSCIISNFTDKIKLLKELLEEE